MHKTDYFILFLLFILGFGLYFFFSYNSHYQRNVIYGTSSLYFVWSLFHHYQKGDLHLSIILEYLLFILLGVIILSATFL